VPRQQIDFRTLPPLCGQCGGIMKSDTVSFGEPIPEDVLDRCQTETARCDCMIVAGTSATVYPAGKFPIDVRRRGGELIEINPHETELTGIATVSIRAAAGEALPQLAERLRAGHRS
jgi:NAD-dependent deacetylase